MKTCFRVFPIVMVVIFGTAIARADDDHLSGFTISDASPVRFTLQDEATDESPSDLALPEPDVPSIADIVEKEKSSGKKGGKGDDGGKDCGGKGCGGFGWFNNCAGPPKGIPQPCFLKSRGIKIGGWLQQGITFNNQNSNGFNGPVATNDMAGEYQMNQLWMYIDRPVDTGGCGWDIGGHIDAIYGSDWRFGINQGLETKINGFNGQNYGLVIPQAYAEVAYNNLSVKVGHFAAILDYEAVPAPMNPFYSHSYSYSYTVPQLVTGALANWKLTDRLSLQGGFHRGWSMFEDTNNKLDPMGGFKWEAYDKRTSIAWAFSNGPQWPTVGTQPTPPFVPVPVDDNNRFVYSLVVQRQVTDRLRYVLVHNYGHEEGIGGPPAGQDAEWYGINQYFLYSLTKCLSANLRAEWLRDDDGRRIAGPGNIAGVNAWNGGDNAGHFFNVTAGLNWRPTANWLVRPEVRYDWFDGPAGVAGLPFGNGTEDDQLSFAVDAVLFF